MYERTFLGLSIDPDHTQQISQWREKALGVCLTDVKPYNFHVTLAFLGKLSSKQHEPLLDSLSVLDWTEFSVTFDLVGYWGKPKIQFIGPSEIPDGLATLAKDCQRLSRQAGISLEKRDYRPHITLQRKITTPVQALYPPQFTIRFDEFHLYESISTPQGVEYVIRETFTASPDTTLSHRERLSRGLL